MLSLAGAMRAAVDRARLHAMTAYPDPAVVAGGSKSVRGALEAVEGVRVSSGHNHLEGLLVLVAANLALSDSYSPLSPYRTRPYACPPKKGLAR
jgi:hypothetical protein